jgi:dienelactone hydrolase
MAPSLAPDAKWARCLHPGLIRPPITFLNDGFQFIFGEVDPAVPMDEVEAIKAAYANHDNAEIVVYPGAAHNFAMPYKPGYQEAVATASRAAVLRCFQRM